MPFDQEVLDLIGREDRHGAGHDRGTGKGAGLIGQPSLGGGDLAVVLRADLHPADAAGGGASRPKHFLSRHDHLHRPARVLGQHHRHRLQVNHRLAAEAAADFGGDELQVADLPIEDLRGHGAELEVALGAAPDGGLALLVDRRRAGVGLDVALVGHGDTVLALRHHVGLLEAGIEVAPGQSHHRGDVARLVRLFGQVLGEAVFIEQGCVRGHGLQHVEHRRQRLVLHLDGLQGPLGNLHAGGRHRRHRVAMVQGLVAGHDVASDVSHVAATLAADLAALHRREVGAGHCGVDAVHGQGLGYVHVLDAGMGMGTAQNPAVQHVGQVLVGAELRPAGDLVHPVRAYRAGSHISIIYGLSHWRPPVGR